MVVIADTSPLNYLVLTGYADVLLHLYGQVAIPHAVLQELLHPNAPPAVARWIASAPAALRSHVLFVEVRLALKYAFEF